MKTRLLPAIILLITLLVTGCQQSSNTEERQAITLGYCPTMENIATELQVKNNYVSILPYGSTADALYALNNNQVDAVLVGRIAKQSELDNVIELRLREGLTLVGKTKKIIAENELQNKRIHTYLSKEQIKEYVPENPNIIYHESLALTIKEGLQDLILIDWKDYSDDLELVIPIDQNGKKVEKYRMPVIYSFNKEIIDELKV